MMKHRLLRWENPCWNVLVTTSPPTQAVLRRSTLSLHNRTSLTWSLPDQTMPDLSGADLATLLLKIRPELPVILATGYSTTINSEKAKAIGIRSLGTRCLVSR
jgi:CheY-like chemotaxis protein